MNPSLTLPNFFQFPSFVKRGRGRFFNEPLPHPPLTKGREKVMKNSPLFEKEGAGEIFNKILENLTKKFR